MTTNGNRANKMYKLKMSRKKIGELRRIKQNKVTTKIVTMTEKTTATT